MQGETGAKRTLGELEKKTGSSKPRRFRVSASLLQVFEGTSVNCIYGPFQIPPEEKPKTFVKVVCRKSRKNKILGLHVVGKGADELMQGFAVAIKMVMITSFFLSMFPLLLRRAKGALKTRDAGFFL